MNLAIPKATLFIAALMSSGVPVLAQQEPQAELKLNLGDAAPTLKGARLIKGELVQNFAPGNVYVVEFWATWCGPCKKSMPHLSELAQKYRDRVYFIAVDVDERIEEPDVTDLAALKRVARFAKGAGSMMDFNVAMDDTENSLNTRWQKASGSRGVPNAFIVKEAKVLWIGQPDQLDTPLAQILAGTYDIQPQRDKARQDQADWDEMMRLWKYPPLIEAGERKDHQAQVRIIGQAFATNPRLETTNLQFEFFTALLHVDSVCASTYVRDFIERNAPRSGSRESRRGWLTNLAGLIIHEKELPNRSLDLALQLAQESFDLAPEKRAYDYSLLAEIYFAKGDTFRAVELQKEAVSRAEKMPDYDPSKTEALGIYKSQLNEYQRGRS